MGSFDQGRALGQSAINAALDIKMQKIRDERIREQLQVDVRVKQQQAAAAVKSTAAIGKVREEIVQRQTSGTYKPGDSADLIMKHWDDISGSPSGVANASKLIELSKQSTVARNIAADQANLKDQTEGLAAMGIGLPVSQLSGSDIQQLWANKEHIEAWKKAGKGGIPTKEENGRKVPDIDKLRDSYKDNLKEVAVAEQEAKNAAAAVATEEEVPPDDMIQSVRHPDFMFSPSRGRYYKKTELVLAPWASQLGDSAGTDTPEAATPGDGGILGKFKEWTTKSGK